MEYIHETHKIIYLVPTVVIIDEKTCRYEVNYDAYLRTIVVDYFYLFSNRSNILRRIIIYKKATQKWYN